MNRMCWHCNTAWWDDRTRVKDVYESFEHSGKEFISAWDTAPIHIEFSVCPNCNRATIEVTSMNRKEKINYIYPKQQSSAIMLIPEYVPETVRIDYLEAASVLEISPKASATLARRCLQGMIHDFWGITEKNLNAEITSLKGRIPLAQWNAIDGLRRVGNIGAHMDSNVNLIVDVGYQEANMLVKLLELLIEKWYIARHDEETLLSEITEMAMQKEDFRKSGGRNADSK